MFSMSFPRRTSLPLALAALSALAPLAGCAPDKGPGSLVVTYVLGNNKDCDELGIEQVEAIIYTGDLEIEDPVIVAEETKFCSDDFQIELEELDPGVYNVAVLAYDAENVATLDNLGEEIAEQRIEIFEAAQASLEAELTNRPAQLSIRWRLGPDGFGNCEGQGIDRFEITAFEVGGANDLLQIELDCELGGDDVGYRNTPDPERLLNGGSFGEVGIQPLAADGSSAGQAAALQFEPVGPGYPVQLTVECTVDGCEGA